jgi:GNAT superfamily N-acetyltransferase
MTMSAGITVRLATHHDLERAASTLGDAFADYSWTRHTVAADDHRARMRQIQELFLSRVSLDHGRVWVTDRCKAVAVWSLPDTMGKADLGAIMPALAELAGDRAHAWGEAEEALAPYKPKEPVWTLETVGVQPEHQGRGLGSAVIRPGIEAARQAGFPAWLGTSSERNLRLYQRLGFRVTAEVDLPNGGPRTWCMILRP